MVLHTHLTTERCWEKTVVIVEARDGDFESLKELELRHPVVLDTLIKAYKYWIAAADVDGFRIKIWDKDDGDSVIYDMQMGDDFDADPVRSVGGGQPYVAVVGECDAVAVYVGVTGEFYGVGSGRGGRGG